MIPYRLMYGSPPPSFANTHDRRAWIREALESHEMWADRLQDDEAVLDFEDHRGVTFVMNVRVLKLIVGDVEHHEKWAKRYRKMLEAL